MGKLIYSMLTSLDGYTEGEHGRFGWGAPEDEEVHSYINALASSLGTYLYGRRMYETRVCEVNVNRNMSTCTAVQKARERVDRYGAKT